MMVIILVEFAVELSRYISPGYACYSGSGERTRSKTETSIIL